MLVCSQKGCSETAVAVCYYSSARSQVWMENLDETAPPQEGGLIASLMLCSEHAEAFKAPLTWTLTDNRAQPSEEADDQTVRRPNLSLARTEDMEDTPLLQRAFRSVSG